MDFNSTLHCYLIKPTNFSCSKGLKVGLLLDFLCFLFAAFWKEVEGPSLPYLLFFPPSSRRLLFYSRVLCSANLSTPSEVLLFLAYVVVCFFHSDGEEAEFLANLTSFSPNHHAYLTSFSPIISLTYHKPKSKLIPQTNQLTHPDCNTLEAICSVASISCCYCGVPWSYTL